MSKTLIAIFILTTSFALPCYAQDAGSSGNSGGSGASGCASGDANSNYAGKASAYGDQIYNAAKAIGAMAVEGQAAVVAAAEDFKKNYDSCISDQSSAAMACLSNCSANITDATTGIGSMANQVASATSANGSCSNFSKIMDLVNKALTAYTAACSTAKGMCIDSCGKAMKALDSLTTTAGRAKCTNQTDAACTIPLLEPQNQLNALIAKEKSASELTTTAGKLSLCNQKYKELSKTAGEGIASAIAGLMQGNQCADKTAAADCSDATQAKTQTCLCQANPRLAGCPLATQNGSVSAMGGIQGSNAAKDTGNPELSSPKGDGTSSGGNSGSAAAVGGSTGAGAPIGGASGGGGSGSNPGGNMGKGTNLNTNILAGTGGGSGGGGWGNGGSSGLSKGSGLDKALPQKDPAATLPIIAAPIEITGAGQSNWEKVTQRYIDNKPTLPVEQPKY